MPLSAAPEELARVGRERFAQVLALGLAGAVAQVREAAQALLAQPAEYNLAQQRRDLAQRLLQEEGAWLGAMRAAWAQAAEAAATTPAGPAKHRPPTAAEWAQAGEGADFGLTLLDDFAIDLEIVSSRLAMAIMDRVAWEFSDLCSRLGVLEGRQELHGQDTLRPPVLARTVLQAWTQVGLSLDDWPLIQEVAHAEFADLVAEAFHEANRVLMERGVMPEIDLRPFIRRSTVGVAAGLVGKGERLLKGVRASDGVRTAPGELDLDLGPGSRGTTTAAGGGAGGGAGGSGAGGAGAGGGGGFGGASLGAQADGAPRASGASLSQGVSGFQASAGGSEGVHEETRLLTRSGAAVRAMDDGESVLRHLNDAIGHHLGVGDFAATAREGLGTGGPGHGLAQAMGQAQQALSAEMAAAGAAAEGSAERILLEFQQRKQSLKAAASSSMERASIEIVALMFQSIFTEERIPASVRVWFARLQMPVLRLAVTEPDFFATTDHPARRLIDRMGACVMGFDRGVQQTDAALEREIKRVVQVIEAYPDTGRKVFQTVLEEFEAFLERYFSQHNQATSKGVSLAQQVEQRETLAIQYTIELRRQLNQVPVQSDVREFLFRVWADVMAVSAMQSGPQGELCKAMKRAASELIWSSTAKVNREERAEVIRKLPALLKTLREGMAISGLDEGQQEVHIQQLNAALAAAFSAKAASVSPERMRGLMSQLAALEDLMPEAEEVEIDESMLLDLSDYESEHLEVVAEGGSMPTQAMLAWAGELQVGTWYRLDYRSRIETVQLAWKGLRRELSLFVSAQGRGTLFQRRRLAAFLQAGLLVPAQEESLTVAATRSALVKIDADPSRLLN